MRLFLACFLSLLFSTGAARAGFPESFRITYYSHSALPEEGVNNVVEDSRGFLWIGTTEALVRYNGHRRETWYANPNDQSRFLYNNIQVLGEIRNRYMLFTSGSELWMINIINLQLSRVERFSGKRLNSRPVRLSDGHWFLTDRDSFYFTTPDMVPYRVESRKRVPFFTETEGACFELNFPYLLIYGGNASRMFIMRRDNLSCLPFEPDIKTLDNRAPFFIPQAYDSTRKRLYLSAYFNGIYYCDLDLPRSTRFTPVPVPLLPDGAIRKTLFMPGGELLMGGDNDIYITDLRARVALSRHSSTDNYDRERIVTDISKGKGDYYWVATNRGIARLSLDQPVIRFVRKELGFNSDDEFKSIVPAPDGNCYLLSERRSLFRLDPALGSVQRLDSQLQYCWGAALCNNRIYAGGGGKKLIAYDLNSRQTRISAILQPFFTPNTDLVTMVFAARNGDLWFSCNGSAGLIRQPAGSKNCYPYSKATMPGAIPVNYVHTAAEDSRGHLYFATNKSQYILIWEPVTQEFSAIELSKLVPKYNISTGINHLYIDAGDNLWIALDGASLLRYNLRTRLGSYYDINDGFPSNSIYSITSDARNRIWCGTPKGLFCFNPVSKQVFVFTEMDGLPETNYESRGLVFDREQNLLFAGGRKALAWFDPEALIRRAMGTKPQVYINEMKVNNRTYYFEDEENIRLSPAENNIEFTVAVPEYQRNEQLLFQYKLSGGGNEWVNLGNNRTITFYDLPHGQYVFSVRCRFSGTDNWYETPGAFRFRIHTPWQQSIWFRALLLVLFLFLAWFVMRNYYLRKMERQQAIMEKEIAIEQERTKMARELHDGLGSMLSGVKHSFTAMNNKLRLSGDEQQMFHSNMAKLNESILELRNITHNMASDALLKYGLPDSLQDYCVNISATSGLQVRFSSIGVQELQLGEERTYHLFRVVQELLQNIIKHADATQVLVQLSLNEGQLYITVEDDGKGFDLREARKKQSMGLKNIEARVRGINGQLDFQTSPGKGTSVLISLPV